MIMFTFPDLLTNGEAADQTDEREEGGTTRTFEKEEMDETESVNDTKK